jgi:hypothetical protein
MKSMLISTTIILAIGLGGSFLSQIFAGTGPHAAAVVHPAPTDVPVRFDCDGIARLALVQA